MKVSLNAIKQLIDFDLPPVDELVQRINQQLGGVEEVVDLGEKYKDALVVKVVECEKHANADKLNVCKIDAGTGELVQVVCGAPNVHAGTWAVWLPPGSVVPETYGTKEPFELGSRELRGVMSNGMLASARELGLGDDHDGIVELTKRDTFQGTSLESGARFADVFGLNDTVIDIENKMFTHRPDLFGQLGVAREIAGIFGYTFKDPQWYTELQEKPKPTGSFQLTSFNEAGSHVSRLMLVGLDNVKVGPSPLWLQTKLVALGGKPINNVVDVTNYVMLMSSQPTHCYDYDKLAGGTVGARLAQAGDQVKLLNGKTYQLTTDDIVIVDGERPIGLGGIMGGGESEVGADTKRIVLEVANFDMYAVRKSGMRHGLFTEALTRFNKGQSMLMNPFVMQYTVELLTQLAGAQVATETYDDLMADGEQWRAKPSVVPMLNAETVKTQFINARLGLALSTDQVVGLLRNVGFECEATNDSLSYWAPAWRMDIQDREDVVEEVGRLYGFDKLPRELPLRSTKPAPKNAVMVAKQRLREGLRLAGANEVLTYSFVHENIMKRAEQDVSQAFQLSNALSPDLQYYRLSVLPSLLDKVRQNIKAGHERFVLYEIGKAHNKKYHADDDEGLPKELSMLDAVYACKKSQATPPYYYMRRLLEQVMHEQGVTLRFKKVDEPLNYPLTAPFDLQRSALVETTDDVFIGIVGELKQRVLHNFKLSYQVAAMSLDLEGVGRVIANRNKQYHPLSKYPSVTQDISLKVPYDKSYETVAQSVDDALSAHTDITYTMSPVGIYQSPSDTTHKTITLRLAFRSTTRTLEDSEVNGWLDAAASAAHERCGATRA